MMSRLSIWYLIVTISKPLSHEPYEIKKYLPYSPTIKIAYTLIKKNILCSRRDFYF